MTRVAPVLAAVVLAGLCFVSGVGAEPALFARETGGCIPLVRVGLAPGVSEVKLSSEGAWRLGVMGRALRATCVPAGEGWSFRASGESIVIYDEAGRVRGSSRDTLFAFPENSESAPLQLNGRPYRGQMLLWISGGAITAVDVVDLESYLRAVLPQEMGPQPLARFAALRAQAVAARSYTLAMLGRRQDRGFDLLATVEDQVYGGVPAERPTCSEAIEETRGVVATYDHSPIMAYYSSTCGGHTSAPEEVWSRSAQPYLRAVRDETSKVQHSFCSASPWFHWSEEWKGKDFEAMLAQSLPKLRPEWRREKYGRLTGLAIRERFACQRVSSLRLQFERGHVDLCGDEVRWALRRPKTSEGLRSALLLRCEFSRKGGRVSRVRISGQGYGHGVGMCQFGAMGMSEAGYSYDEILRFYYRGADLRRYY